MTLGQLRTFLAVARAGSIRGAARALVVTEPSVSAAVSALRRELGAELVERVGRGIRLTAAGTELSVHAAQILGLADRAARAVKEAADDAGSLRLAAVTTAGEYVVPRLLAEFLERYPGTQVSLEVANRAETYARLLAHEADLAIGGRPPQEGGITGYPFQVNRLVVVGAADHRLSSTRRIDPARLSGETWLLREQGSGMRENTEEFMLASGIEAGSVLTIGSNGAINRAASAGLGITLAPLDAVAAEIDAGELARLRVVGTPLRREWHILYREQTSLPRSAHAFLRMLRGRSRST